MSARKLPWVLPVTCKDQTLCCLHWRLCFGDAFVYGDWGLSQLFNSSIGFFAINVFIIAGDGFEC